MIDPKVRIENENTQLGNALRVAGCVDGIGWRRRVFEDGQPDEIEFYAEKPEAEKLIEQCQAVLKSFTPDKPIDADRLATEVAKFTDEQFKQFTVERIRAGGDDRKALEAMNIPTTEKVK